MCSVVEFLWVLAVVGGGFSTGKEWSGGVCGKVADKESGEKAVGVEDRGERLNFNCFVCANSGLTYISRA